MLKTTLDDSMNDLGRFDHRRNWGVIVSTVNNPVRAAFTSDAWVQVLINWDIVVTIFYC